MLQRFVPSVLPAVVVAGLPILAFGAEGQAPAAKASWRIAGELEESCSCDAACPCWFGSKPTRMSCGGGQVLFISKGTYGGVALDGLALGQFVRSPEGKSMAESIGNWDFGYVYVDAKAGAEQRKALEAIALQIFPPLPQERIKVRVAPITRTIEGKEHRVSLGSFGSFTAKLLEGGLGGAPRVVNPPLADPVHKEYSQGTSIHTSYHDAADWDFDNTNYMHATFDVTSADYEKFAAAMADKMGKK